MSNIKLPTMSREHENIQILINRTKQVLQQYERRQEVYDLEEILVEGENLTVAPRVFPVSYTKTIAAYKGRLAKLEQLIQDKQSLTSAVPKVKPYTSKTA